jgi:hypothetical protein
LIRRAWQAAGAAAVLALLIAGGCLRPTTNCKTSADCPAGFVCANHICCSAVEHPGDAGELDAGRRNDAGILLRDISWEPLRPNVMLVIDRSGSMVEPIDESCQCDNPASMATCCTGDGFCGQFDPSSPNDCKWKDLITALADPNSGLVQKYQANIRFGVTIFPQGPDCQAGVVVQEPAEMNFSAIAGALGAQGPGGGTPTANTLNIVGADPNMTDPLRSSYALLVTDGVPNCNAANGPKCAACVNGTLACSGPVSDAGTSLYCNTTPGLPQTSCDIPGTPGGQCLDGDGLVAAVAALHKEGVPTAVLGLGSEVAYHDAFTVLNAAAYAGGLARQGSTAFYPANSTAALASFLDTLVAAIPQCKFLLAEAVPASGLVVMLDGTEVAADGQDGYVYNQSLSLVSFEGSTCRVYSNGQSHMIEFESP